MTLATAKLLEEARRLPAAEQLRLVDQILAELDVPDPQIESLWADEAADRSNAVRSGELSHRPIEEALKKYRG